MAPWPGLPSRVGLQTTGRVGLQTIAKRAVADRQFHRNKSPDDAGLFCVKSSDPGDCRLSIVLTRGDNLGRERREYIGRPGGLFNRTVPSSHSKEFAVMDQQRDRQRLERKLEQCRRLSAAASDPTTSIRLAKLIEELEHSLREAE
jgi:hypothetical protein